jgi:hypothetical protein
VKIFKVSLCIAILGTGGCASHPSSFGEEACTPGVEQQRSEELSMPEPKVDASLAPSAKGPEARMVLAVLVGTDGRAKATRVEESSGFPRLDEAMITHVKHAWQMRAYVENCKPKEKWGRFAVTIRLDDGPAAGAAPASPGGT